MCNDIPIDISFNQVGGIATLGFLEEVSRKLGKDQIYKKSVIMLKAWATYEGRILGSHLGCMTTYALEVLILYILNEYYDEMTNALDVFFKFFEVFGKFNWQNQILTIYGPIEKEGFYEKLEARNFDVEALALEE